jgi:photosystem II stability/assembly factor-like uncharacterized protein
MLQFRDVQGVSDRVAYLLAAGVGTNSRIYKTEDGGDSWSLQFENQDPNGFYDCFGFWDASRGITMADAIGDRFPVIRTTDGTTWEDIGDQLPAALPGEAAFAASGTCIATQGETRAWIATGVAERARVLATTDGGQTWAAYDTPIVQGTPQLRWLQHRVPRRAPRRPGRRRSRCAHGAVRQLRPLSRRRQDMAAGRPDAVPWGDLRA